MIITLLCRLQTYRGEQLHTSHYTVTLSRPFYHHLRLPHHHLHPQCEGCFVKSSLLIGFDVIEMWWLDWREEKSLLSVMMPQWSQVSISCYSLFTLNMTAKCTYWFRHLLASLLLKVYNFFPISAPWLISTLSGQWLWFVVRSLLTSVCPYHPNLTLLFLSSLWTGLNMWGHFDIVLNLRNEFYATVSVLDSAHCSLIWVRTVELVIAETPAGFYMVRL